MTELLEMYYEKKDMIKQVIRYGIVGVINTIVGYGIYYLMLYLGYKYTIALTLGSIIGVSCSFMLNKFWTFRSRGKIGKELLRFLIMYGCAYIMNLVMLIFAVEKCQLNPKIAQVIILLMITTTTYFGNRIWCFNE